ncbi:Hypothetical_protein [Hexamita inflata]|uniref:Hypothetical_protein n=1 Tax=Hexamita inflata TaxID=28002 RepID=A0AA86U817_9EUKA|nr:Hypothetical protein HINF_LOCUS20778 [Hexamita inflata]
MIYLILVFQNQYIGPEPYTICVVQIYLQLRNIQSRDSKQQMIFGVQVDTLLAFWTYETTNAFGRQRALTLLFLYHLSPTARSQKIPKDLRRLSREPKKF